VLFLLVLILLRIPSAATDATATKDCSLGPPCTITTSGSFTLNFSQMISWQANYLGSGTQGRSFYIHHTGNGTLNEIPLSTSLVSSFNAGTYNLPAGTYDISITYFAMGPGSYTITYNSNSTGEPHIRTVDGNRYDFQSVGEFVLMRQPDGLEIQTRQAPIPTTLNPGPDPHDSLALCVSINSAVAARVAKHRVTYEPNLNGVPDPSGLQLRVDGVLTSLDPNGLDLGNGGHVSRTSAPGGLEIDFPDRTVLFVTPGWFLVELGGFLSYKISYTANPSRLEYPKIVGNKGAIGVMSTPTTWALARDSKKCRAPVL